MKTLFLLIFITALFTTGCGRKKDEEPKPDADIAEPEIVLEQSEQTTESDTEPVEKEKIREPETFEEALLMARELEEQADFTEAIRICRNALAKSDDPARTEILRQILQRLVVRQNEALELSFAAKSLSDGKDTALTVARQKLREGGETGRILLRKAVREGDEKAVLEAGAILVELDDKYVPTIFIERLRTNPPGPVIEALVKILRDSKAEVDYGLIAELCDSAIKNEHNRLVLVNVIMDSLEQSVTLPPIESDPEKPEVKTPPALEKLPARIGCLESKIVKTLLVFLEQHVSRPKDAAPPTPGETATAQRAKNILIKSGFPSTPAILVDKLTNGPPAPVAELAVDLLKNMTSRMDNETLVQLANYVKSGGDNQAAAVLLMIDSLEQSVTPLPPTEEPARKMEPQLDKIPARLDKATQNAVLTALTAFIENQSAPKPKDAPAPTPKQAEALQKASKMLVNARFPEAPALLIAKLSQNPAATTADALIKLMEQMTTRFDNDNLANLSAYISTNGAYQIAAATLLMNSLEQSVTPSATNTPATPALDKLPARLDGKQQDNIVNALLTFVETRARANNADKASDAEKAALARAKKILTQSRLPQVPGLLVRKLTENPDSPAVKPMVNMLSELSDQLDSQSVAELSRVAAREPASKALITDLVIHILSKPEK